jgi:N-acetyltransferase 10
LVRPSVPILKHSLMRTQSTSLLTDKPSIRAPSAMPPLLQRLSERRPEQLDYLGVSYGLTPPLLR